MITWLKFSNRSTTPLWVHVEPWAEDHQVCSGGVLDLALRREGDGLVRIAVRSDDILVEEVLGRVLHCWVIDASYLNPWEQVASDVEVQNERTHEILVQGHSGISSLAAGEKISGTVPLREGQRWILVAIEGQILTIC